MAQRFAQEEAEILLAEIKEFPSIYDPADKTYKDFFIKGKIWIYIAKKVGKSVVDCRKKWKNIKDSYMKHRKNPETASKWPLFNHLLFLEEAINNLPRSIKSDNAIEGKICNSDDNIKLNNLIKATDTQSATVNEITSTEKILKRRHGIETITESQSDSTSSDMTVSHFAINKRHRLKVNAEPQQINENDVHLNEDDVDLFLRSIAITLKKLSPQLISQAKLKILSIVNDLQFP